MQHLTTFLDSFDDGIAATVRLLHWAVSVYGSNAPLILALSIVPVVSRWGFVLGGEQLSGTWWLVIDTVVGLFRVLLFVAVLAIVFETTPAWSGLSELLSDAWPLLCWQILLLSGVFLVFNVCMFLLTMEVVIVQVMRTVGLSGDPETVGSLVSFTVKNLGTIPLFVICLCGLAVEFVGG